ncbi:uncharacterized protein B0H18DRAFT_995255 [Fomitopsis serialis]|uniref:uncharacterized protein n=1 Tax=Fomitopsis serialis TaxID=139415 RepID=UPI0020073C40|nr:uncharacterized protein B0H18DRAFT_995255 [Neoantrodia serialis]KAH9930107.1 hypothetical protein B0H18DRAFT_995255 [Neoantrodia serialis]
MSRHRRSLLFLLLSASHLYVLAAPAGPGMSASVVTETLLEIPTALAIEAATTTRDSNTEASSTPAATDLASRIADGSLTLVAATQTILFAPPQTEGPSTSGLSSSAVFAQDVLSAPTSQPASTSGTTADDLQVASDVLSSRTTLYVPPSSTEAPAQAEATPTTLYVSASSFASSGSSSVAHSSVQSSSTISMWDPNPTSETEASSNARSQQSRRSAILAAFLIIGVLTMFGFTYGCMRLKLPMRLGYVRRRCDNKRVRFADAEDAAFASISYPASVSEKDNKDSIAPDPAVFAYQEVTVPTLARQPNGPVPPSTPNGTQVDWRVFANYDGQFEDVTHILSTDVFAPLGRHARGGSHGSMSVLSGSRNSSPRTSGGGASFTGASYQSCESHYSVPTVGRQSADVPTTPPRVPELDLEGERTAPNSPPSPALPATPQSVHTEPGMPVGCVGSKDPHELVRGLRESAESACSEWDVARAYGAHSSVGGDSLVSRVDSVLFDGPMESVDVGGKKCVLVQG